MHAALSLVLCFVTSAAIWLLIEAEFLAVVLVLVYVGAVMVLFLFVVMMLDINLEPSCGRASRATPGSAGSPRALVIVEIVGRGVGARRMGRGCRATAPTPQPADYSNTAELGGVLYTKYAYPFELAAMLLLVAIVAAITLTMRRRAGLKYQDINKQVAVRREDRVRMVKMAVRRSAA